MTKTSVEWEGLPLLVVMSVLDRLAPIVQLFLIGVVKGQPAPSLGKKFEVKVLGECKGHKVAGVLKVLTEMKQNLSFGAKFTKSP
ncbi:hypothetical protein RRG08_056112 [Elysia crispata]|uniref:Uncharacterized protein n=1 Tax=Elysia crispata TaxID=231223 RepID=A0AAE1DEG4_9GAST|nr:hypothetical protein RRG08_056112 [Elysia crispata]